MNKQADMHQVYVGIGSNIEREKHIRAAVSSLQETYGGNSEVKKSPVYETPAVGFKGDDFYNLVASFQTSQSPFEIEKQLKAIEHSNGRNRQQGKFSPRTLDIDLLLVDDLVINEQGINIPRDEIEKYAFVLAPLADLAADLIHPLTAKSIASMWHEMLLGQPELAKSLSEIEFNWQ